MESIRRTLPIGSLSSIFLTLFLLLGLELTAQKSLNQSAEFRIAHGYFQQAQVLYREGRYEPAAELLEVSLEFFPDYSESAFLYALVYLREQETTLRAIEYLEAALESDTWSETQALAGAAELIRVYVRTNRFQEARQLFSAIGETGLGGRGNSDLSALWASTLIGLGRLAEAQTFLSEALRRFPQSSQVYTLLAQVRARRGNRNAARDVLQRGIKEIPGEAELVYQLAALEGDSARRRQLVEAYLAAGGNDPGAVLLAISGAGADRERFIDLFFRLNGNTRISYLDQLLDRVSAQEISERTGVYTGERIRDENRDGYYEQRFQYQQGTLTQWTSDQDQNGIAEATVEFQDGIPSTVKLRTGNTVGELEYRYSEYPFLESAVYAFGNLRREYQMVPYGVRRPVFVSIADRQFALSLRPDLNASEESIRQNAHQVAEYAGNEQFPVRRIHLLEGRTVRVDELPDSSGNFTRTVFYSASIPVEGIRDLDGDGNPEIREQYLNGRLWKIILDQDGDGVIEFEQVFESGSIRMYWDYNNDGLYDSREFWGSAGNLVRGFSSMLNGTYDLTESGENPR